MPPCADAGLACPIAAPTRMALVSRMLRNPNSEKYVMILSPLRMRALGTQSSMFPRRGTVCGRWRLVRNLPACNARSVMQVTQVPGIRDQQIGQRQLSGWAQYRVLIAKKRPQNAIALGPN